MTALISTCPPLRKGLPEMTPPLDINTSSPKPTRKRELFNQLIKSIALTTLKELAAGLALTVVASFFVSSPAGTLALIISAIAIAAINLLLRTMAATVYLTCKVYEVNTTVDKLRNSAAAFFCDFVEWIAPINFSALNTTTRDVLVHEVGHAAAASVLYTKPRPKIEIFPFNGGVTRFFITPLTKIGVYFGDRNARLIVAGAGPATAVFASTIDFGIAHQCRKSNPRLSRYLNIMAGMNLFNHLAYAYSALSAVSKKIPGHDFVVLWGGGIHPYISMTTMIALPLIVKTGLFLVEKCSQPAKLAAEAA